jgi:dihydroxyacetone kinase-like protein
MATLAVALKTATHPSSGEAIFDLGDDEMEIGMGQHGEAGTGKSKMMTADETAEIMITQLSKAVNAKKGDKLFVMLNGAGATTLMELYIVFRKVKAYLADKGIEVARSLVGEYLTVQEMAGFQMFVGKMDDEILQLWDAPCDTPYLTVR